MTRVILIVFMVTAIDAQSVSASFIPHFFKSGWHAIVGHGGRATAREGVKHATKQYAAHAARQSVRSAASSRAALALRHFGDDALKVGGKLASKPLSYADDLAKVSGKITSQSHRRLMMLAPELKKTGQAGSVIAQLAKSSKADKAVAFLWRHKGKLATVTAAGAAAWHADAIAEAGGKYVLKPAIESMTEHVAGPIVASMAPWLSLIGVGLGALALLWLRGIWRLPCSLVWLATAWTAAPFYVLHKARSLARFAFPKQGR